MMNQYFIKKTKFNLNNEEQINIKYGIELVNFFRIKLMLILLFIIQILFIAFNDFQYLFNPTTNVIWKDFAYFIIHSMLLTISIIGFFIAKKFTKVDAPNLKPINYYFTPGILIIYLTLISILNVLDQLHLKNLGSLFMANLLICGGIFILNFPKNLCIYVIPFLCYIGGFFYLGYDKEIIFSNSINGLIFFLAVIIISTSIYNFQYEVIAENIILENSNKQLNYLSNHDPLTGLLNRRCFMEQMEKKKKEMEKSASVVLCDIDFFKSINDQYGHPVGDLVLTEVSSVILKHMKEGDLAVRWGGEEFLLLLYNTSLEDTYVTTNLLCKEIEEITIQVKGLKIQVTASFGIAMIENEGDNLFYSAYKAADIALYQAKDQGRNRVMKGDSKNIL